MKKLPSFKLIAATLVFCIAALGCAQLRDEGRGTRDESSTPIAIKPKPPSKPKAAAPSQPVENPAPRPSPAPKPKATPAPKASPEQPSQPTERKPFFSLPFLKAKSKVATTEAMESPAPRIHARPSPKPTPTPKEVPQENTFRAPWYWPWAKPKKTDVPDVLADIEQTGDYEIIPDLPHLPNFSTATQSNAPSAAQRTFSSSQQFVVYHPDARFRAVIARHADSLAEIWRKTTGIDDTWKWPIIIHVFTAPEKRLPRPTVALFVGDGNTLKIQINVPPTITQTTELDYEILSALTLEAIYRDGPPQVGKPFTQAPVWLVEALCAIAAQQNPQSPDKIPADIFTKLVDGGNVPKIESFIRQRSDVANTASRKIYQAQALALLQALQASPEAQRGLHSYLIRLRDARSDSANPLLESFPSLSYNTSLLPKLWTLQIAANTTPRGFQPLGSNETRERLADLLAQINVSANDTAADTAALKKLSKDKGGRQRIEQVVADLTTLETSAHPVYRPIVAEYRRALFELMRSPGIVPKLPVLSPSSRKMLNSARTVNRAADTRMESVTDYMNWLEVTNPAPADFSQPSLVPTRAPGRGDAISRALDAAEERAQ